MKKKYHAHIKKLPKKLKGDSWGQQVKRKKKLSNSSQMDFYF